MLVVGRVGASSAYIACLFIWPGDFPVGLDAPAPPRYYGALRSAGTARLRLIANASKWFENPPIVTLTASEFRVARMVDYVVVSGWAVYFELVPDGVARVEVQGSTSDGRRVEVATAAVRGNIALWTTRSAWNPSATVEWLARDGHVISTFVLPPLVPRH